jgi:hypothetical protein
MSDTKTVFTNIYNKGIWNNNHSDIPSSGPGSSLKNTVNFRRILDTICDKYSIKTIVDLGCGDLTWIPTTRAFSTCHYTGIDIVPSLIDSHILRYPQHTFLNLNALTDEIPSSDLIIIRDVIFHMSHTEIDQLFKNIRGKYKYYFITSCNNPVNRDTMDKYHFHEVNLSIQPFNMNSQILSIEESEFNRRVVLFNSI